MTRNDLIEYVKTLLGTPYHHTGRIPGVGLDCVGVAIVTIEHFGADVSDIPPYTGQDDLEMMLGQVRRYCTHIGRSEGGLGDLIVFHGPKIANHCGVVIEDDCFIHAWSSPSVNKVVSTRMDTFWERNFHSLWRWNGLDQD